jgi:hypothetical protein
MNINPINKGAITDNFIGIGTVSRRMVQERAVELAIINGRFAQDVSKADWEQAKRELSGEPDADPKDVALESVPESEQWNIVPGWGGFQVPELPGEEGEDSEGRSQTAQLFEQGIAEAEHDQMLQAARESAKEE